MPSGVSFQNRTQAEGVRLQLNLLDERRYQSMERNTTHQNAYTGYDIVEDTIEEFKDCVHYIASLPSYLDDFGGEFDDGYEVAYESGLDELWEIIVAHKAHLHHRSDHDFLYLILRLSRICSLYLTEKTVHSHQTY